MRRSLHAAIAVLVAGAFAAGPAWAEPPLPTFYGVMSFPAIQESSDPEEFSWQVELSEGQELQSVDSQHAMVYYTEDHQPAFGISATPAHDASGATVPTSLAVSGVDVITLTVHHRAGNPLANGAPFAYPVLPGSGWIVIGQGGTVPAPLEVNVDETFINPMELVNHYPSGLGVSPRCLVPKLSGRSLAAAKRRLRNANCKIGRVSNRKGAAAKAGRVVKQNPKAGMVRAGGATVNVTLAG
jgi:PASTA domain